MIFRARAVILEEDTRSSGRTMPTAASRDTVVQVRRLHQLRARVNAMDPRRVDAAIAALLAIEIVAEVALVDAHGHSRALSMVPPPKQTVGLHVASQPSPSTRLPSSQP